MTNHGEVRPIAGHHAAWGSINPATRIQPYKLTPGSVDTMCVRVREKIDIHGVGTDVVEMQGTFTVRRDHPCAVGDQPQPKWGESCLKTEFRSLELYGESPVLGTVRVHLDPAHVSHGEVGPAEDGSLAASCVAHCYAAMELPELSLNLTTGDQPVTLSSKVVQVPPVGDVARSENSAPLMDEAGRVVGEIVSSDIEVGEVICSFPLGSTTSRSARPHAAHEHTRHSHPGASGPSFFTRAPGEPARVAERRPHEHPHLLEPSIRAEGGIATILARLESELRGLAELVRNLTQQK